MTVKPTAHGILLSRSVGVPVPHCEIIIDAVEENELPITGAMEPGSNHWSGMDAAESPGEIALTIVAEIQSELKGVKHPAGLRHGCRPTEITVSE